MKTSENIMKAKKSFLDLEYDLMVKSRKPIKFDLTEAEQLDLFIITEMYQIDKAFNVHIREALSSYMKLKFNL